MTREEEYLQIELWSIYQQHAVPFTMGWHTPNGGKRGKQEAVRFQMMGVVPGVADLIFLKATGVPVFLELKAEGRKSKRGKISKEQDEFKQGVIQIGLEYHVSYTLDDAVKWLISQSILKESAIKWQSLSRPSSPSPLPTPPAS